MTKKLIIILIAIIILSSVLYFHKSKPATLHYVSNLGFSFDYPKDMSVTNDPEEPRIFIVPNSYNPKGSEDITAVIISASPNNPPMTPLKWLKGPDSGADMSKGFSKLNIDGQEAISVEEGAWIVVDTPDKKRQLSIATLPSQNPSKLLMTGMSVAVGSLRFDR